MELLFTTKPHPLLLASKSESWPNIRRAPLPFHAEPSYTRRSIVPCQDTPGIKTPYTAELTVDKPLVAVMSAVSVRSEESESTTTYFFNQKIPIPAYLLAIVIGDIVSQDISPRVRCGQKELTSTSATVSLKIQKPSWKQQRKLQESMCGGDMIC